MKLLQLLISIIIIMHLACGTNYFTKKSQQKASEQDKAQSLMNKGEYLKAIEILEKAIETEPNNYNLYVLCAASYAALSGFDIIKINLQLQNNNLNDDPSNNLFQLFANFLPKDYDETNINYMETAIEFLEQIPEALRKLDSDTSYGASAAYQYSLYNIYYSIMILYMFIDFSQDGKIDINKLLSISISDATNILTSLNKATLLNDETNPISSAITTTINSINSEEGSNSKEKLISYIYKQYNT